MTTATTAAPSWDSLKTLSQSNPVGNAMMKEVELRKNGKGSAHVQNQLRLFGSEDEEPSITLFRDHAGWCPYCQKTVSFEL
jgi:glutathione S-transferase